MASPAAILSHCAVVEVTTIREDHEFEDLDYLDEEEGIEKLKDAKGNFILWPRKDIIIKNCSSHIVLPQSREDEGTPSSQNTIRSTTGFTPSQNSPKTTPPPENPPSTQPLEHHSPQHHSPPHGHFSKSPPHTTPQNLPIEQAPHHRSPPHGHSPKSPRHTTPPQNPPTEQAHQHRSHPHVHSLKSPHTTPPLQNPPTEQALQHRSPPHVHSPKSPHTTSPLENLPNAQKSRTNPAKILISYWRNFMMVLRIIKPRNYWRTWLL
jgi:hypothetical protein